MKTPQWCSAGQSWCVLWRPNDYLTVFFFCVFCYSLGCYQYLYVFFVVCMSRCMDDGAKPYLVGKTTAIHSATEVTYKKHFWQVTRHQRNQQQPPQQQQQEQYNLVRLRFNRRGAATPLWGLESCPLPSRRPPIQAITPYVVRTPHHPGPTTEETDKL